jgi:peptidyl-prolyl cis-trans isomerase C
MTIADRISPAMKRLLREPLIHFLLLGSILFGVYAYAERGHGGVEQSKQIRLTIDDLSQLVLVFRSQWRRDPAPEELRSLVEDKVQEEVLYREAIALGIDKDDTIVKRRMAQKMQFFAEDVAAAREPMLEELGTWYQANRDQFAFPTRVSFRHLYFSPDRRGGRAHDDAAAALTKLAAQPEDSNLAANLADAFMFQVYYRDREPEFLGKEFGPNFALAVAKLPPGSWQGPVESGFGWHLVFVDTLIPGRVPAFEEVEADVKIAWLAEQKTLAWQKAYQDMRAKYTVLLPGPAESAPANGETSHSKQSPALSGERGS